MSFRLNSCNYALIVGAGHGIGFGLVHTLLVKNSKTRIMATYRKRENAEKLLSLQSEYKDRLEIIQIDATKESEICNLSNSIKEKNIGLDLIVNCIGMLHNDDILPEKSLKDFNCEAFIEVMRVNSIVTPLLAKHFEKQLNNDVTSIFATISAKVGSIEDNRIGGWYSYRASKAALNMLIKTIAIEFTRKRKKCVVLAVHPGTTKTELSQPFIKRTTYKIHETHETASNILNVIENRDSHDTGKFLSWDAQELPW